MNKSNKKLAWIAYVIVGLASVLYIYLTFAAPQQNTLNLTKFQLVLVQITFFLPYILSWFAGISGAMALRHCSGWLNDEEEARGFRMIGSAVAVFVAGSILTSVLGGLRNFLPTDSVWRIVETIVNNYIYALSPGIAALVFFFGVTKLVRAKQDARAEKDDKIMSIVLVFILACLYVPLIFTNPNRQLPDAAGVATYYLPDFMIVLTIILPLIASWYIFLAGMFRFNRYILPITGDKRRRGLKGLFHGLWLTLFASIFLQILISLGSERLAGSGLGLLLVIIYIFVALQVVGFIFIYFGAQHARKALEASYQRSTLAPSKPASPPILL